MHASCVVAGIASVFLGFIQVIELAAAFGRSPILHSQKSKIKSFDALQMAKEEEQDFQSSHEELMDEAVMLYSEISRRTRFNDNTEGECGILKLRGDELSMLVEDAVFDARGILRHGAEEFTEGPTSKEPETLSEISQALDHQILMGYEETFSEEELEQWIGGIESLQQKLQSQLAALPPGSGLTTELPETTITPGPLTPFDKLQDRLETMRTLIDPTGRNRVRPPSAEITIVAPSIQSNNRVLKPNPISSSPESNTESDNSGIIATQEEKVPSKLDVENAFIESINEAVASQSKTIPREINDANIERENKSEDKSVVVEDHAVATTPPPEPMTDTESNTVIETQIIEPIEEDKKVNTSTVLELENALIESMNNSAAKDPAKESQLENPVIESINNAAQEELSMNEHVENVSHTDLELENALIESMNNAAAKDPVKESQLENPVIESINNATQKELSMNEHVENVSHTDLELENTLIESMNTAASDDLPNESELKDALIESTNDAATDNSPTELKLENALIDSMNLVADDNIPTEAEVEDGVALVQPKQEGTDVVSTVATAAALGAAAVTKLPIVLAGVALGPVIRDSISYAKARTKKAAETKQLSKPKPKVKAWSAFDPKPNKRGKSKVEPEPEPDSEKKEA